jgi:hypothetical protein
MSTQYEILTHMLLLLKSAELGFTRLSRTEYLIYRIKILLLKHERHSTAELNRICPVATLEHLNRLIAGVTAHDSSRGMVQQLEAELEQVIRRFEETLGSEAGPDETEVPIPVRSVPPITLDGGQ